MFLNNLIQTLKEFANKFMKFDPEFRAVAVAFVIACIIWASPIFFLKDDVWGKIIMVAGVIAMTMYHRIAGLIALIAIIAVLNQTPPTKEGMTNPFESLSAITTPTAPSISFTTPAEFRKKYCVKGIPDDPTKSGKMIMNYMLSPAFFTKMDASGNPIITNDQLTAFGSIDPTSFNKCTPLPLSNGATEYETIHNMCDPKCGWTMKAMPATATSVSPSTNDNDDNADTEGFTPMLRPHIRTGRRLVTNGLNNLKSSVNRLKRQLF